MKKNIVLILSLLFITLLSGCSLGKIMGEPIAEVKEVLNSVRLGDYAILEENESFNTFLTALEVENLTDVMIEMGKNMEYKINKVNIENNTATVSGKIKVKDINFLIDVSMKESIDNLFEVDGLNVEEKNIRIEEIYNLSSDDFKKIFIEVLKEKVKDEDVPFVEVEVTFYLIKGDEGWKLTQNGNERTIMALYGITSEDGFQFNEEEIEDYLLRKVEEFLLET